MASSAGEAVAAIFNDIEQFLATKLTLNTPFQDETTISGQRFGICDYSSWAAGSDEFAEEETVSFNLWIVSSYASFTDCRNGLVGLSADIRSLIPSIAHNIDQRGILLKLTYPTSVPATKRAPMTPPNTQAGHLWIGDIVVPMGLELAIAKSMCGEYR